MTRQTMSKMAENFRHAILYLIREAYSNGFKLIGTSLEKAERAIDDELDMRGISQNGQDERNKKSRSKLN